MLAKCVHWYCTKELSALPGRGSLHELTSHPGTEEQGCTVSERICMLET